VATSVRPKDSRRKAAREERAQRKAAEKAAHAAERQRLKHLKREEIVARLRQIQAISGVALDGLEGVDLEAEFDPDAHAAQVEAVFDDEYYADAAADAEKPEFPDDLGDIEDMYGGGGGDGDGDVDGGDGFVMDADYDAEAAEAARAARRDKKKRRKKGAAAAADEADDEAAAADTAQVRAPLLPLFSFSLALVCLCACMHGQRAITALNASAPAGPLWVVALAAVGSMRIFACGLGGRWGDPPGGARFMCRVCRLGCGGGRVFLLGCIRTRVLLLRPAPTC
jgi:hypothetical protein